MIELSTGWSDANLWPPHLAHMYTPCQHTQMPTYNYTWLPIPLPQKKKKIGSTRGPELATTTTLMSQTVSFVLLFATRMETVVTVSSEISQQLWALRHRWQWQTLQTRGKGLWKFSLGRPCECLRRWICVAWFKHCTLEFWGHGLLVENLPSMLGPEFTP